MYVPFRNAKTWLLKQIEDCKALSDVNSRICFLGTSVSICLCLLILTVGLFYSERVKDIYAGGVAALLGGHGIAAWGRFKTKTGGGDDGARATEVTKS